MNPLEPYYEIITDIYVLCVTLFSAYCYVLWIRPAIPEQGGRELPSGSAAQGRRQHGFRNCGKIGHNGVLWKSGAAYAVVMIALHWIPYYISNVLAYGLGTLAAFLVLCLMDRRNFGQKVFLAVTFFCMRWQSWSIASNIMSGIYSWWTSLLFSTKEKESLSFIYTFVAESYAFWLGVYFVDASVDLLLGMVLMYGAVGLMMRAYRGGREYMKVKELLLLVMPSVSGVLSYGMLQFHISAYERETGKSIFDLSGYCLLMVVYSLISYIAILVSVYVFRKWKQEQEADGQRRVFMMQIKDMQSHIMEVERLYSDMRRLRHDMGNHLMTLEQLYGREEYEAAGRYAEALKAEIQDSPLEIRSGNPVTDAILSGWKEKMEEQGVTFTCDFHYPQRGRADVFDISIILNNALGNAMEAVSREQRREVLLSSRRVKNMYVIEAANTFTGELRINGQTGLPFTTKEEDGHGFGLVSIRHAAQKYYGDIEIGVEEYADRRCCVLRVMLQIIPDASFTST